eukprot:7885017-Pyramimonas_sp.AAC.1
MIPSERLLGKQAHTKARARGRTSERRGRYACILMKCMRTHEMETDMDNVGVEMDDAVEGGR